MRRYLLCTLILFVSLAAVAQDYVGRYDFFSGYSYMNSPDLSLTQHGYNLQGGLNLNRWLALGADYSWFDGNAKLNSSELDSTLQQQLHSTLTPGQPGFSTLPPATQAALGAFYQANPGYTLSVPFDSRTWTFAAGPQINIRKFKTVTLWIHPDLGVIHESATLKPPATDLPVQIAVAGIAPTKKKSDDVVFYGVGGGFDLNFSKHVSLKTSVDYVHCFLFENLLAQSRNSVRISVGPIFHFGGNVKK